MHLVAMKDAGHGSILWHAQIYLTPFSLVVCGLLLGAILAVAIFSAVALFKRRKVTKGRTIISALRLGGPVLGALAACETLMDKLSTLAPMPTLSGLDFVLPVYEALSVLVVGLATGLSAIIAHTLLALRD